MSSESVEGMENVQTLLIFALAEEWKQVLLTHRCVFGVHEEYGKTIQFPEGTTRTLLYSREGRPTNCYRIQLPDGLELREALDDAQEARGTSTHTWHAKLDHQSRDSHGSDHCSNTIGPRRTEKDFVAHVEQNIQLDPEGPGFLSLIKLNA